MVAGCLVCKGVERTNGVVLRTAGVDCAGGVAGVTTGAGEVDDFEAAGAVVVAGCFVCKGVERTKGVLVRAAGVDCAGVAAGVTAGVTALAGC